MTILSIKTRQCLLLMVLAMIAITVTSAFAIVWMQQQISRTAQNSKSQEIELAEMVRKLRYLDERIATLHQPVVLQGKVAGVLRPSVDEQIVWVNERSVASGRAYAVAQPYEVSMDLAFLDLNAQR
ncbi:MAG: hypothetical protein ACI81V_000957 [Lentimonas sp.]|jgi:hypothetical protein